MIMKTFYNTTKINFRLFIMATLSLLSTTAQTQEAPLDEKRIQKWSGHFDFGIGGFQTNGIPMSRNQINLMQVDNGKASSYKQQSGSVVINYEIAFKRNFGKNWKVGLMANFFKDSEEYIYNRSAYSRENNVQQILLDSLNTLSVVNLQSYFNLGFIGEFTILKSKSSKHRLIGALGLGMSFNRTPDRTEFDYFEEENFVEYEVYGSDDKWYITHTHFKNGFFLAPSLNYSFHVKNNNAIRLTISELFQWHSTEQRGKILNKNSNLTTGLQAYTLQCLQIKLGYSF